MIQLVQANNQKQKDNGIRTVRIIVFSSVSNPNNDTYDPV